MKSVFLLLIFGAIVCLFQCVHGSRPSRSHRKEAFEDFLVHLDRGRLSKRGRSSSLMLSRVSTDDEDYSNSLGSGHGSDRRETARTILDYFKDVPRSHWSCCMLGRLAGDKGFHCHAQFYKSHISLRNRNRAHNKKLNFYGQNYVPLYGKELMFTFQKCVAIKAYQFNRCCYAATVERKEMHRWHRYHESKVSVRGV